MIRSLQPYAPSLSPHAPGANDRAAWSEVDRESKTHQAGDSQKSALRQKVVQWVDPEMTEQKVILLERKGIVLVGVEIARHMVDMWA
jgi:hypothetical protein